MAADDDLEMYRENPKKPTAKKAASVSNDDDLEMYREKPKKPAAAPKAPAKRFPKEKDQTDYSFMRPLELVGGIASNAYDGASEFGTSVRNTLGDVVGTTGKVRNIGGKLLDASYEAMGKPARMDAEPLSLTAAKALAAPYKDGLANALAKHPYARFADAVTVAGIPAGAGLTVAGRVGQAVGRAVGRGAVAPAAAKAVAKAAATRVGRGATIAAKTLVAPSLVVNDAAAFAAGKAIPAAATRMMTALNPTAAATSRAIGTQGEVIQNALSKSKNINPTTGNTVGEIVKGSFPSAAEAVVQEGIVAPRFAGLVKSAEARIPDQVMAREKANQAARAAELRITGGTPEQRMTREALSDEFMKTDYPLAGKIVSQADQKFIDIMEKPNMSGVLNQAAMRAKNDNRPFQIGENKPEWFIPERTIPEVVTPEYRHPEWNFDVPNANVFPGRAPQQKMPEIVVPPEVVVAEQTMPMQYVPPEYAQYYGESMHDIKKIIDDKIAAAVPGSNEARQLKNQWGNILTWLGTEGGNAQYNVARQTRARGMKNVNQMSYAQLLEKKLSDSPQAFLNTRDNPLTDTLANSNVRNMTRRGEPRYSREADLMTPDQLESFDPVSDDLRRMLEADAQASRGLAEYGSDIDTMISAGLGFSPNNETARALMGPLNRSLRDKAVQQLSTTEGAAGLVGNALSLQRMMGRSGRLWGLAQQVHNAVNPVGYLNRYPAIYNALGAPQQQEQQ